MDDAYRTEKNVDVRERLLLVRRVLVDNEQAARVAENEFYRSRWWTYKWLKRFADSGGCCVLFVCVENAGSQMAEGFFTKYSPEGYEPLSAGTRPVSSINPLAIEVMREVGIDISKQK